MAKTIARRGGDIEVTVRLTQQEMNTLDAALRWANKKGAKHGLPEIDAVRRRIWRAWYAANKNVR